MTPADIADNRRILRQLAARLRELIDRERRNDYVPGLRFLVERQRAESAERQCADLRALLLDTRATLSHAQTFIASREKMHPVGIELYQENIRRIDRALAPEGEG